MSLVNGYRVKCQSYKRMAEREKETRRREEKLGNWSLEKASRKAAVRQLKSKLKRGSSSSSDSQSTLASSSSAYSEWPQEEVRGPPPAPGGQEAKEDEEGYSRLHNTPAQESMEDLRDWKTKKSLKNCCNCSVM